MTQYITKFMFADAQVYMLHLLELVATSGDPALNGKS
jgi:hypothetical protein